MSEIGMTEIAGSDHAHVQFSAAENSDVTRTTSIRKVGRPKGSKDGSRLPNAPLRGRPPRVASSNVGNKHP